MDSNFSKFTAAQLQAGLGVSASGYASKHVQHKVILVCKKCEELIVFYVHAPEEEIVFDRNQEVLCSECYKINKLKE